MVRYVLTDGHGSYIKRDSSTGRYLSVRNKNFADKWEERWKAQNILKSCLNAKDRKRFHVADVDDGISPITGKPTEKKSESNEAVKPHDLHIEAVKALSREAPEEVHNIPEEKPKKKGEVSQKESEATTDDNQLGKWSKVVETFTELVMDVEARRDELTELMSNVDKEITDIQHYIELNNLNAYQGFLAYKMLKIRLKRRRKIKNELQILTQLGNCKVDYETLLNVQNAIKEIDNKIYTPRVLTQLFD